ncbi:excalibur calcium-binding domain-containing protein [Streptomyces sp. NPDC014006]
MNRVLPAAAFECWSVTLQQAPIHSGLPGYRSGLDRAGDGKASDWS